MATYSFVKTKFRKNTVYLYEPYTITKDLRGVSFLEFPNTVDSIMDDIKNVNFINPPDGSMRARVIIASFDKAFSYLTTTKVTIPEALLIVCKTPSRAEAENFCRKSGAKVNMLFTDLDASSVSNSLNLSFQGEINFLSAFLRCESGNDPMQSIVDTLAERIRCNVYYTNASGILLYESASQWEDNELIRNIETDSCIPEELMSAFYSAWEEQSDKSCSADKPKAGTEADGQPEFFVPADSPFYKKIACSGLYIYFALVPRNSPVGSWLVLISDIEIDATGDTGFAFDKASTVIESRLEQTLKNGFFEPKSAFQRFMYDLKNENLQGGVRVSKRLGFLEHTPDNYDRLRIRFAVIDFPDPQKAVPYSIILRQLRLLFPDTNITAFDREIILMFFEFPDEDKTTQVLSEPPHKDELNMLLGNYGGYMSFGRRIPYYANLRTQYLLTKEINSIASTLEGDKGNRVYVFHTYVDYLMIDWFSARFYEKFGYSGLAEFIHPAVLNLWDYDKKNDNNLSEVLYQYLMNEHSIKKTADAVFMHRNTVAYKIKQIESIANINLESIEQCQLLILSCQMLRYMLHDSKNALPKDPEAGNSNPAFTGQNKEY